MASETKDEFKRPDVKRPTATRRKHFEKFLWQEIYDEYIREKERQSNVKPDKSTTEYYEEFCKDITTTESEEAKEAIIEKYPLYRTQAITLWNMEGDVTKDFKKRYSITRPIQECTEQFG